MSSHVYIVMAIYRPDPDHLTAQLETLAAQQQARITVIGVIADTLSRDLFEKQAGQVGLDHVTVPCSQELDAVRAFEAGLIEAVSLIDQASDDAEPLIALCDQDDLWHPTRLAEGIRALADSDAQLVHSDARLVAGDGRTEIQPSVFAFERRLRNPGLRGLLYRNNITGMTLLMRPDVARLALPFPPQSGVHFYHDLWLGLIAAATGGVELINKPLVDYRQHDSNVMGAIDRQKSWVKNLPRRLPNSMWLRREAAGYALARYLAHSLDARLQEAITQGQIPANQVRLRSIRPYLRQMGGVWWHIWDALILLLKRNTGLARIAIGFGVVTTGRTVWTMRQVLGPARRKKLRDFDERLYSLSPGIIPKMLLEDEQFDKTPDDYKKLIDTRKVPQWQADLTAPTPALNVLVPTLNPTEVFAGIVTAFDIGLGMAARGYHVRFIATDLPVTSPMTSRAFLLRRLPAKAVDDGLTSRVSVHCGIHSETLPAHQDDIYLATAWWSAHIADSLITQNNLTQKRFLYLIQDFEPNFYAWGGEFSDAMASYDFDFEPIFNTGLLRDYFQSQGFAFATPDKLAFHPSIDIDRYASSPRPATTGGPRRLALYGRPEVARNMFPTAVEALAKFIETENLGPKDIELVSIGLSHPAVDLPGDLKLNSLGKLPWEDYPDYLRSVDVGLSLMYSPHPSHPPIEMAASGVRVVTNSFGPKDLSQLSSAIQSVPPKAADLASALSQAWAAKPVSDAERQIDLNQLGLSQSDFLDQLAAKLDTLLNREQGAS